MKNLLLATINFWRLIPILLMRYSVRAHPRDEWILNQKACWMPTNSRHQEALKSTNISLNVKSNYADALDTIGSYCSLIAFTPEESQEINRVSN